MTVTKDRRVRQRTEYHRRYRHTPTGRVVAARAERKYRSTPKGKAALARLDHRYKNTPAGRRVAFKARLKTEYGIEFAVWEDMLIQQAGRCDACSLPFRPRYEPALDHNHSTGALRGLLCMRCNTLAGYIENNRQAYQAVIDYLGHHGS